MVAAAVAGGAAAAAVAVLLVAGPVVVVLEPPKHQREVLETSVTPECFQVATSLSLLQDSEVS